MGTVAKSTITLTSISDGYSVSLSPSSCNIHTDYDGSNPRLDNAKTTITVYCGDTKVPILSCEGSDTIGVGYRITQTDDYSFVLRIVSLPDSVLDGAISLSIKAPSCDIVL